ncbi:MAG: LamG-like jellyroll fold domain-containing protein [Thermodesulfobacteriota bacterium]
MSDNFLFIKRLTITVFLRGILFKPTVFFLFVAVLILQNHAFAQTPNITRAPYLQTSSPSSIVIRWRTDLTTDSRVMFGTVQGNLTSIVDDPGITTEHEVEIVNLSPDTKYYYAVGTSTGILAGDDPNHFFITHPPVGSNNLKRILVLGDSGGYFEDATVVRDAFYTYSSLLPFDLWLMLGDNAYSVGTDSEFQSAVFDMYPELLRNTVLWPTRGNHEVIHSGDNNDYYELFTMPSAGEAGGVVSGTEAYYSFDYGNIHFICLDSEGSDRSPEGPMLSWLQQDLASTTQDWIIAYFHHPPYSKGSHNSDNPGDSGGKMRDMRENALPILEAGGVDLVLAGHSHAYERSMQIDGHYLESNTFNSTMIVDGGNGRINEDGPYIKPLPGPVPNSGTVYLVLGSSSWLQLTGSLDHPVMVSSEFALGFVVLEVDGNQLDVKFIDETVTERDSFSIVKEDITGRPVASFTATPNSGEVPLLVDFDASGSSDPEGDPLTYSWDFGDGNFDSGVTISHTYTAEGSYIVTLTVDDGMDFDTAQMVVTVFPEPSQSGLIAHWELDESGGTTALDSAGFNDGILNNGPVWQPGSGKLQGALEFDGVDDYVDLGTLDIEGGTGLTLSAWIMADDFDVHDSRIISKTTGISGTNHYWMLSTINQTGLRFRLKTGGTTTTLKSGTGELQAGAWYHVAATYDGTTMRIYKDGVEVASTSKTGTVAIDPTVSAAIGNQPPGAGSRPYDGLIDDVRIYNRALTQIEITALANP